MRKIVLSGGTGLIGKHLSRLLVENGYEVVILTRNPKKYSVMKNISYVKLDLNDLSNTLEILSNAYSIVNLAGAGVADKKWTDSYKKEIYDSRINITSHLVSAINKLEKAPESFISASAVGIYGDRANEKLTEKSEHSNTFLANVCIDWEREADKCKTGVRVVKGRIGVVLSADGGALPKMLLPFKMFVGGSLGSGQQWMAWIHIEDICRLFLWAIENSEIEGVVNFSATNPIKMNQFAKQLGNAISRPAFLFVPEFVLKVILGESSAVVLSSQRVIPEVAIHSGFEFKYPNLEIALKSLV